MDEIILQMKSITKTFPGVKALDNVNLKVKKREIHSLCGENGAGKSTLMKVLSGVHPYGTYEGDIIYKGEVCKFKEIRDSEKKGIVIIHQELALIPYLSIAENIFLGNEQQNRGVIDWNKTYHKTKQLLRRVGLDENPKTLVCDIGVGKQQLVEIAKALSKKVELLILDEPTAALNEVESENLLNLLLDLKEEGISSILISHKLNEVSAVADQITILRDGSTIETIIKETSMIDENRIIRGMVGRDIVDRFPKRNHQVGDIIFEVKDWVVHDPMNTERKVIDGVNFNVRAGEVIGLAGLMGSGRTELAMSLFGRSFGTKISGEVYKNGKKIDLKTIEQAVKNGVAYVTEDRKQYGLVLIDDICRNISLSSLEKISYLGKVNENQEKQIAEEYRLKMNIKSPSIFQKTENLSGGNQQKVVLSKWILTNPDVLILDEPTRGIDVGAKYEIYLIINELVAQGKSVIIISSELPEVLGMSDRVYVMNEGKIVGELQGEQATQESVMTCIMGS
ncbi:MAG: sugar ABC transporter ATP-binding protein [Turicibacter sp.]|nr:sugar ABC transporter ATP-binding protein [Turicibacter sp.]